jgi:hypothetical protein
MMSNRFLYHTKSTDVAKNSALEEIESTLRNETLNVSLKSSNIPSSYDYIDLLNNQLPERQIMLNYCTTTTVSSSIFSIVDSPSIDMKWPLNVLGEACSIASSSPITTITIQITYYQNNTDTTPVTENLLLNGQTPVNLSNNFYRLVSMKQIVSGSTSSATVYLGPDSEGFTGGVPNDEFYAVYKLEHNEYPNPLLYVPPNKTMYIDSLHVNSGGTSNHNLYELLLRYYEYPDTYNGYLLYKFAVSGNLNLGPLYKKFISGGLLHFCISKLDGVVVNDTINVYANYILLDN